MSKTFAVVAVAAIAATATVDAQFGGFNMPSFNPNLLRLPPTMSVPTFTLPSIPAAPKITAPAPVLGHSAGLGISGQGSDLRNLSVHGQYQYNGKNGLQIGAGANWNRFGGLSGQINAQIPFEEELDELDAEASWEVYSGGFKRPKPRWPANPWNPVSKPGPLPFEADEAELFDELFD